MTRCAPNGAIAVRVPLGITIQEVIRLGVVPISYVHALGQQLTPERMTDWNNVWASFAFFGKDRNNSRYRTAKYNLKVGIPDWLVAAL